MRVARVCARALAATSVSAASLLAMGGVAAAGELPPGCTFDAGTTTCVTDVELPSGISVGGRCIGGVVVYPSSTYLATYERTTVTWQGRYANDRQRLLSETVETVTEPVVVPERIGGSCTVP